MSFTLTGVSYAYPEARRQVLSGLDLTIPDGATTAILGASGAGKSTLLYLLGLLWEGRLASGRIAYREGSTTYDYDTLDPRARSRLRRDHFGFALQSSYLLPYFTCAQNVAMPLAMSGARPDEWSGIVADLIRRADAELSDRARRDPAAQTDDAVSDDDRGLFEVRDKKASAISGGQRQRISVLRSIVHDPQVVFADEPFSSLDALNTGLILNLLHEWRTGALAHSRPGAGPRSLILVCHDLRIAYDYAEYFVVLARGGRAVGGRAFEKARFPNGPDDLHAFIESEAQG